MENEKTISGEHQGKWGVEYLPRLNYAVLNNKVRTCKLCVIENDDEEDWQNVKVAVEGELLARLETVVNVVPKKERVQIGDVKILPDVHQLLNLTEAISTQFDIVISMGEKELLRATFPLSLEAYDQWMDTRILPQLLSAFVIPNHPLLSRVIMAASKLMEKWTCSSAMDAYQTQDRNRVRLQVAAIYEALRAESIVYCEPPASFELTGAAGALGRQGADRENWHLPGHVVALCFVPGSGGYKPHSGHCKRSCLCWGMAHGLVLLAGSMRRRLLPGKTVCRWHSQPGIGGNHLFDKIGIGDFRRCRGHCRKKCKE